MITNNKNAKLFARASALQAEGKLPEALALFSKILKNDPGNVETLKRLSLVQLQTGALREGYETIKAAQKIRPKSKSVLQTLAAAAMGAGEWAVAIQCFEAVTRADPDFALYYQEWSRAEYELNNISRAIARYQDFLKKIPKVTPEHHFTLGRLFFQSRQPGKAATVLDKVLGGGFVNSELLSIRANCYLHAGHQKLAKEFFERALELDPDNAEAHLQYRRLVETGAGDPIFEQLRTLAGKATLAREQRMILNFLLGNLHDGLKDYGTAFSYYQKGNTIGGEINSSAGYVYDSGAVAGEFAALREAFPPNALKALGEGGSNSELPVFIVGMPRSGTTLLEQIISAHPEAEGRGELDTMHYIITEFEDKLKQTPSPGVKKILDEKGKEWRDRYLEALAASNPETRRVTDKLPANFRCLGLIAALFPRARIIHIQRNPLDTSISIFCNMFDKGHPYATGLASIGDYYRQYNDLMGYWKEVLSVPILDIRYEDLVAHQEQKSREVISFLGLEWDPACLEFHKLEQAAMTISSIQVRKPMNTSSIARWKRYRDFLGPLEKALGADLLKTAKEN
ncbi:MAG: sulfotransferase [Proteobacteria bacterium]|nr:sulfotransferase [Pseudomonadota bacterium]